MVYLSSTTMNLDFKPGKPESILTPSSFFPWLIMVWHCEPQEREYPVETFTQQSNSEASVLVPDTPTVPHWEEI